MPPLVRFFEIISRSCSATAARMWIVSRFAVGHIAAATNSTFALHQAAMNATLRASRSSLAITSFACACDSGSVAAAADRRCSLGLDELGDQIPSAAVQIVGDRLALPEAQPDFAARANPQITG